MNLSTRNYKSEDDIGFSSPLPGRYHVVVKNVDESMSQYPSKVPVEFEILAGTIPGQAGKTTTEFFSTSEKAMPRLVRFAMATGLMGPDEEKEIRFRDAIGRQLVIEIEEFVAESGKYAGKTLRQVSFVGMWSLENSAVADVPKDAVALKAHAERRPLGGGVTVAGPSNGAGPAPAAAGWDNL